MLRRLTFFLLLFPCCAATYAQQDSVAMWGTDAKAEAYLLRGKRYLSLGEYRKALVVLDSALQRPSHPKTTTAQYLRGMAWFYLGEGDSALAHFDRFLRDYPRSRFVADTRYHRALLLLDGWPDTRAEGIEQLLLLYRQDSLPDLSAAALGRLRQTFFQSCDTAMLQSIRRSAPPHEQLTYLEPICFCLATRYDQSKRAEKLFYDYKKGHQTGSAFLERLFDPRRQDRYGQRQEIKIAVFLPLFLEDSIPGDVRSIPRNSRIALEFWEGFQMAYEEIEPRLKRKVTLKVFDSRRDSLTVVNQLAELDRWYPDLVIGDVYNVQTEILSRWAERTGTPQIVPFSPSEELLDNSSFTFLAHPEIAVHGVKLATYGLDSLQLDRVAVISNGSRSSERLAASFIKTFEARGGEVVMIKIDSTFNETSAKTITASIRKLRTQRVQGVFLALFDDQESAGLVLNQMSQLEMNLKVLGSPHMWKRFENIDRDLKDRFQITFSTSFMCDREDSLYLGYFQRSLAQNHLPPSEFHTQGYDIGNWILAVTNEYPFEHMSLADYLRNYPSFRGIHQDFDFQGKQSNQFVNLGQYRDGSVKKIGSGAQWRIQEQKFDE